MHTPRMKFSCAVKVITLVKISREIGTFENMVKFSFKLAAPQGLNTEIVTSSRSSETEKLCLTPEGQMAF